MAIQKSIDISGITYAESYGQVIQVGMNNRATFSTSFEVVIYENATARSKSDFTKIAPPKKSILYLLSDADSATYFADSVLAGDTKSPIEQAYTYLKLQNDTENGINWTTGTTDV